MVVKKWLWTTRETIAEFNVLQCVVFRFEYHLHNITLWVRLGYNTYHYSSNVACHFAILYRNTFAFGFIRWYICYDNISLQTLNNPLVIKEGKKDFATYQRLYSFWRTICQKLNEIIKLLKSVFSSKMSWRV